MDMRFLQLFSEGEADAAVSEAAGAALSSQDTSDEEFESLIKGKYHDAYHKRVQSLLDKRFSKMKSMENTLNVLSPLTEHMAAAFPEMDKSDTEGLVRAYLERYGNKKAEKPETVVPPAFMRVVDERLKMRAAENVKNRLSESAAALREIYPSFDLHRELSSSPEMKSLILSGVPLRRAFETVNLEKIMGSALRFAVMKAGKDTAQAMQSNRRISENSISDHASSVRHRNVNNLTEKDIREILTAVGNGEKIVF